MRSFFIIPKTLVVALVGSVFAGGAGLVVADSSVLLSTPSSVLQYEVDAAGNWSLSKNFATGSYAGAPLSEAFGLAIDGQDRVYVGEQKDGGRILRFDATGNFIDVFANEGVDYDGFAEAMTIGPDGALYMTNAFGTNATDQVYRFDVNTGASSVFVPNSGGSYALDNPRGLAFGFGGDLFVADRNSNAIRQFDGSTGAFIADFALPSGPQALSYDAANDRLLVGVGFTQIAEYLPGGSTNQLYGVAGLQGVLDVEVINGNVFWTAANLGEVHRLDGFNALTSVVTGLSSPRHMLEIPLQAPAVPTWVLDSSGDWSNPTNWSGGLPNGNDKTATFGDAITSSRTVYTDSAVTVKGITFNGMNTYTIAGTGNVTMEADSGDASVHVIQGDHQFQTVVNLARNTDVDIAAGVSLSFDNALNLLGNTLTKTGDGTLNINNKLNNGLGTVNVAAGILSGSGEVGGALANQSGGTVAPGQSTGTLSVAGDYTQAAGATLAIELGGRVNGLFDLLDVAGTVNLMGTIDISLVDGFIPVGDDSFEIVSSSNLTTSGLTLTGQSTGFSLLTIGNRLFLDFSAPLAADFNGDDQVDGLDLTDPVLGWEARYGNDLDGSDFLTWQREFGSGVGAAATAAMVPEPSTFALLAWMLVTSSSRRVADRFHIDGPPSGA